jgi:membrane protein
VSQAGRSLGATAEKAVPSLDADAVRALPPMISRSAPMPVASSSSRRSGIWPTLGYAALAAIVLAIPNKRPGERSQPADRGRPASGAMGTTRSTDEPREVQHQRAHEPGRGRHATAPWQIPWAGWKDILWRTYQQINEDRVLAVAAGVVFYGLLAVFPAITAVVSLYGLFAKASTINEHLSLVAGFLPGGAVEIVQEQVNRLVSKGDAKLGIGFIFGLAVALWSANAGMKAIMDALNVVYDEKEKRGFIKLNFVSLAFTLAALVAVLLAIGAVVVVPVVLNYVGLGSIGSTLVNVLRWPLLLALIIVGLAVLYRYGPSRREPRWQWLTVGSVVAAIAWLISSVLLSWYLSNFANYDATYGSLGAAIGLMMWLWISSIVILVGAELNAEIEHQTAHDSTVHGDKPLGARGAAMADTVGAPAE